MKLEPLTFNPSVLGSNPRGPTTSKPTNLTAIYSGLLRMADLLALQPNMDIRLHIVAPDDKRERVLREIRRPVFSLLDRGPLYEQCTFLSYASVNSLCQTEYLSHTSDTIIGEYEESAEV